jgi:hypothetical protein
VICTLAVLGFSGLAYHTGWDYALVPDKAPKDISSAIDESNIILHKRRANMIQSLPAIHPIPRTYREAIASPEANHWRQAIDAELSAMDQAGVWNSVPIPPATSLLGTVWVFRKKTDAEGNVIKYKARLCAQGSRQTQGEDYNLTYAPTGRSAALRTALLIGLSKGFDIHQMDAKNAFLNGVLSEEIYLRTPAGVNLPANHCLKLIKSIYGLKQAPRVWYQALKDFFLSVKFNPSPADPCLFVSAVPGWECFVHVYVDDMVIISPDVDRFKKLISSKFRMEDLGEAQHLLGIKLDRFAPDRMFLSQKSYTAQILADYGMSDCRITSTPMVQNTRLVPASPADIEQFRRAGHDYRRALGLLNYLSVSTQPDISFTVSQLSQHFESPGMTHWNAVIHLLRYLRGTLNCGLLLDGSSMVNAQHVTIYTDADYANSTTDRKSYGGYISMIGSTLISWKSKKQPTVSTSTTEAEYRALYDGVQEAVWINNLLSSLGSPTTAKINMKVENQSAIALATNDLFQQRTKHIDIKYHWTREIFESGLIDITYVSTNSMLADMCTKALGPLKHQQAITDLGILRQ